MSTTTKQPAATGTRLAVKAFTHPQGCRTYLVTDPTTQKAMAIDVHLDLVDAVSSHVEEAGLELVYVVDTHTHADHPSGSAAIAERLGGTRVAHEESHHAGVDRHPADGDELHLGDHVATVRHAPGHTPDHMVILIDGALFSGDSIFIGGVARTDFLGGDAGQLFDSINRVLLGLPDETLLYPGHDYEGREHSDIGTERTSNPWLLMERSDFIKHLTANPPPRPANMDDLLRLNREGVEIPTAISASEAAAFVEAGGAGSVIDVRTPAEIEAEHVPGARAIPLDQLAARLDEVLATPAPRLLMCRSGARAGRARETLSALHVSGLSVVEGGIEAFRSAGGDTARGAGGGISLERQVRIGAGVLVLVGCALGAFVHPGFFALAAFVGAGQVFAGVTDWCGMGLLLAKAPWNQRASAGSGSGPAPGGGCAATPPAACAATPPPAAACAATPPKQD